MSDYKWALCQRNLINGTIPGYTPNVLEDGKIEYPFIFDTEIEAFAELIDNHKENLDSFFHDLENSVSEDGEVLSDDKFSLPEIEDFIVKVSISDDMISSEEEEGFGSFKWTPKEIFEFFGMEYPN